MAAKDSDQITSLGLDFAAAAKTVVAVQRNEKRSRKKKKFQVCSSAIELSEFAHYSSHELAFQGELSILRARIEYSSNYTSLKVRDNQGRSLLHSAASNNQIDTMTYLIESGIAIDAIDNCINTALHLATLNEHIESIHLLLNCGANDTICNSNEDAPLHIAVRTGKVHLVQAFLQHPNIDIIVQGYRKRTPLHIAAEYDYVDVVDAFSNCSLVVEEFKQKHSFRLCAGDADKLTPIHFAARCGSAKVLDYMIQGCSNHGYPLDNILKFLDEEDRTPLHAAIDACHTNIVKVLLKFGASPVVSNGSQIPPIHLACYQGQIDIVQAMIEHCGTEIINAVSFGGQTPLHWGARTIHGGQVVRYLVEQGANTRQVDDDGQTALHTAIMYGSFESAQELISADKNIVFLPNNDRRNAIHLAILCKRKAILHYFLQLPCIGELVFQQDNFKRTPLHYALLNSPGEYVSVLVSVMKSQISNIKDDEGLNYLHVAARSGNQKALGILLNSSIAFTMLNELNCHGMTPLHEAGMHGHVTCVELLLSQGAMLHKCFYGFTPFLAAVRHGHYECAKALFDAHPYQKDWTDDDGNTGLHLAVTSGCPLILKLCLDLSIPITRNNANLTFLDQIIEQGTSSLAIAVVQHNRWQDCLDFPVAEQKPHYFIQLVQTMPDIAEAVLDRCKQKGPQPKEHIEYYECYDFKYLRLEEKDSEEQDFNNNDDVSDEKKVLLSLEDDDMMTSINVKRKTHTLEDQLALISKKYSSMEVLTRMLSFNRVSLLTHPLVVQYLKVKWRGYGRLVYGSQLLLFFLQVLLLSSFIIVTPPPRLNVSDIDFDVISSNSTITTELTEVSIGSTIIRFMALFLCVVNTVIWLANVFSLRLEVFNITKHELMWMIAVTLASTYAFLIPWKFYDHGFTFIFWEAGAVAIFTAWFTTCLFIKPFDLFGVYVTMFIEVLSTLLKAMFICILFLIAFAFTLFILVGDIIPFARLGDSFFIIFSYLLGEINYETYVRRAKNDSLQYPILTYIFVLLAASLLAVVVMNLLIGLAVGDIDTVKRNALLKQRSNEVRIFNKMEAWMPKRILQHYNKRFHTVHPNKPVSLYRAIWRHLWRSLKADDDNSQQNLQKMLEEQQRSINSLRHELVTVQRYNQQQHEELKSMIESLIQ